MSLILSPCKQPVTSAPFLGTKNVWELCKNIATPFYITSERLLRMRAQEVIDFPNAYGLTARYAMKAWPNRSVIKVFHSEGLHIDASSGYEVERALEAGVPPEHIQLTAQEWPHDATLMHFKNLGVLFNACSLHQLERFGKLFPGSELSVRINPGLGSGGNKQTNVGGPSSSFGIWHEHLGEVLRIAKKYKLDINRMHTHIGSGSDPEMWKKVALMSLKICAKLPEVHTLSLGGGYKVARVPGEKATNLQEIGMPVAEAFADFHNKHGRMLELEVEPGTYLVANATALVATITDIVDTGKNGYKFLKIDSGMTEVPRPSYYGSQHPLWVVNKGRQSRERESYIVSGHCCESGDILTPAPGEPGVLLSRLLPKAKIGDKVVIGGAGAYCSGMAVKNYNSFPEAAEYLVRLSGEVVCIRRRQETEDIWKNERVPEWL